ncbi:hypothetical protein H112_01667 [Trichophyton rubrum D6]|uniref:Uncharacterized protein n=2 Tax=Trichophyton rubrum TaxID=5551 RepID=F2SXK6_TRIRC|nr:uncharacterized protein TERG_07299 [Trichophyton rubrum CBS 118892]EZF26128.1 hypothetical protein H100_01663 [Trichophyton rubrum MR850]EZF45136.1 hypothetical protein H102_01655 [Trichophyton rubrum CBS 100081]EZF55769.1 hypothetical protein H103_01669 [Trichophyton rubrum CBS 288.86]EZF66384.1 hypothetical protein H104_01644 [Trichophyton rubrum CBS 289.86]EZF87678.1 hypothetical protein H110_01667 [Trichophyton rubrum MR1448]EZF98482.1 hypothetical protein H113_01666 [Trichophyton rubr
MALLGEKGHRTTINGDSVGEILSDKVATSSSIPEMVPSLIEKISLFKERFNLESSMKRLDLLDAVRSLVYALEIPRETMLRFCWSEPTTRAAIETAIDLGIFINLCKDDRPKTASKSAKATGAEEKLMARIFKHLAAVGVILETRPDEYRRTWRSTSLCSQQYINFYRCRSSRKTPGVHALPAHLRKTGYRNPTNGNDCAFQLGYNTKSHFFDSRESLAGHTRASIQRQGSRMSVARYPWSTDTPGPARSNRQAKTKALHSSIEPMEHDFFKEQPIKGARAYFIHFIFHDWSDRDSHRILKSLTPAMSPGYSKLLIHDRVITETEAYWESTSLGLVMMANLGGIERTTAEWYALLESARLKTVNILDFSPWY